MQYMLRHVVVPAALVLFLTSCSGPSNPEPLSVGGVGITVAPPPATTTAQDNTPLTSIQTPTESTLPENLPGGPEDIGPDCAKHLDPARVLLEKANGGSPLTPAEAADLQSRFDTATQHCSPDEYIVFQFEMFPNDPSASSSGG